MRALCNREGLLTAFTMVSGVVPARSPKPILQNVKMVVDKGVTTLLATDLEVGIRMEVADVEIASEGAAILPLARFGSILRENSDELLHIEADAQGTVVRGERSEFKLPAEDPNEFPAVA